MNPALFVDSWGWLVLANQREESFSKLRDLYQKEVRGGARIVTSDFVLDEVITFLFAKAPGPLAAKYLQELLDAAASGPIRLERVGGERFEKAWKMRLKYKDRPKISFTDITSFVIMQELSLKRVLTSDHHFEEVNLGFECLP